MLTKSMKMQVALSGTWYMSNFYKGALCLWQVTLTHVFHGRTTLIQLHTLTFRHLPTPCTVRLTSSLWWTYQLVWQVAFKPKHNGRIANKTTFETNKSGRKREVVIIAKYNLEFRYIMNMRFQCSCVNCFLLFEALMNDWRLKWVASWKNVFISIIIIIMCPY